MSQRHSLLDILGRLNPSRRATCSLVIALSAAGGCGSHYYNRSELPTNLLAKVEQSEDFYMAEAKKKAAFVTGCSGEITATSLERTTVKSPLVVGSNAWTNTLYRGDVTTAIGVTACGTRMVYNVVCGAQKDYEAPAGTFKGAAHCDVVQDGGAAEAQVQEIDESDAEHQRQQQAQQQQQQQQARR